jgi:hypothetical protein
LGLNLYESVLATLCCVLNNSNRKITTTERLRLAPRKEEALGLNFLFVMKRLGDISVRNGHVASL